MLKFDLEKRLGDFRLHAGLEVKDHVVALFGPSGSGKSVTLQCLAGLVTPDRGRIEIGGRLIFERGGGANINLPPQSRRIGYVFQNYALFPHLTVTENIAFGLGRLPREQRNERVGEIIRTVRLQGLENRLPSQLSGGQQQRVALARALVTRPAALLLDEPFSALDSIIRGRLHRELLLLLRDLRIPTLLVTHDLSEAYALSREIAVYEAGRILQCGPRDEIYYRPNCKAAARFIGMKNFIPGRVAEATPGHTLVDGPGFALWGPSGPFTPGQDVQCCIRPEHVMLVRREREKAPPRAGETRLSGTILEEVGYGSHVTLIFRPDVSRDGPPPMLHIALPTFVYHRLGVSGRKNWTVAVKAEQVHILPVAGQPISP